MISSGIGAGLVLDGRPFRGAGGIAGEIGHVLVDPDGPICRCGNRGCLETSSPARRARASCSRRSHGDASTRRANRARSRARATPAAGASIADAGRVDRPGRRRPRATCSTPSVVVVGGDLAPAGDLLLDAVREAIDRYAIPAAAAGGPRRRRRARRARRGARRARLAGHEAERDSPTSPHGASDRSAGGGDTPMHEGGTHRRGACVSSATVAAGCALGVAACGSDDNSSQRQLEQRLRARGEQGRQGRRPAARHQVLRPLGDRRPAASAEGVQRRRRPVDDPERPGRQVHPAAAGRAGDHQRRQGPAAGEPRLGLRRGHRGQRQVAGRQGHRLRPPDAQGRADYYVSFDNERSASCRARAWSSCLGRTSRRATSPCSTARPTDNNATLFSNGYNSVLEPMYDAGDVQQGRRPVRARLGQPEGADDLRADAAEDDEQDRRRAGGQRRPRQRGHLRAEAAQARADPGDRAGRDAAGDPEHPRRRPVHDRLQGGQEGGRRGRQARDRAGQGRDSRRGPDQRSRTTTAGRPVGAAEPVAITKDNVKDTRRAGS